jgi:hypothetical protein
MVAALIGCRDGFGTAILLVAIGPSVVRRASPSARTLTAPPRGPNVGTASVNERRSMTSPVRSPLRSTISTAYCLAPATGANDTRSRPQARRARNPGRGKLWIAADEEGRLLQRAAAGGAGREPAGASDVISGPPPLPSTFTISLGSLAATEIASPAAAARAAAAETATW